MLAAEIEESFNNGISAIDDGDTGYGLACLEKIPAEAETPLYYSYFAVCLAKEREEYDRAFALVNHAREEEPAEPVHYLNLGRVYLARGQKRHAIRAFRDGLLFGEDLRLRGELNRIG